MSVKKRIMIRMGMRIGMMMYSPQIHRLRVICRGSGLWFQMPGFVRMRIWMRMYSPQIHRLRVICRGSGLWLRTQVFVSEYLAVTLAPT